MIVSLERVCSNRLTKSNQNGNKHLTPDEFYLSSLMKLMEILCFVLGLTVCGFSQTGDQKVSPSQPDSIFISGNIFLEEEERPESIAFAFSDHWLGIDQNVHAMIDANGDFSTKIFLRGTNTILCRYKDQSNLRHYSWLIVSPGDSLSITVNNHAYSFFGKNAAVTEDYYHMRTQKEWSHYYYVLDTGYRLEPEVYLEFRKQHYEEDMKFLETYCGSRNCSGLFIQWYTGDARVRYFQDLMNYSWKSRDYGLGSDVRLTGERNNRYNQAFLGKIDLDDPGYAMSYMYSSFVKAYFMKVEKKTPFDQVPKEIQITKLNILLDLVTKEVPLEVDATSAKKRALENLLRNAHANSTPDSADIRLMWRLSEEYDEPLQRAMSVWNIDQWMKRINSVEHERMRDLTFLHSFMRGIDTAPNLDYEYKSTYANMKEKSFRDELTRQYEKKKQEDAMIKNPSAGIHVAAKDYNKSVNELLSDIVKANRNKVVVIDFWATWCPPCLDDFESMRTFKETLSPDSISFVYICSQSSFKMWLKQIRKYDVKGQHFLISDLQYDDFKKRFNLKGFPAYIIIDANKKIHKDIPLREVRNEESFSKRLKTIKELN